MREDQESIVHLEDMRHVIKKVLQFIYTWEVPKVTPQMAVDLLQAADMLFLEDLKTSMVEVLCNSVDISNMATFLELALAYQGTEKPCKLILIRNSLCIKGSMS